MHLSRTIPVLALLLVLAGCVTTQQDNSAQILGSWESTVGGFKVITTYTDDSVSVDGYEGLSYDLDGNQLVIDGDETSLRVVSFPSGTQMVQMDAITKTQHEYSRLSVSE